MAREKWLDEEKAGIRCDVWESVIFYNLIVEILFAFIFSFRPGARPDSGRTRDEEEENSEETVRFIVIKKGSTRLQISHDIPFDRIN